jgi:hypothetical protein
VDAKAKGWLAGCGCGCLTYLVLFLVLGAAVVFAGWAAYEADLTDMGAEVAMPAGAVVGLLGGGLVGLGVLLLVKKKVGS